MSGDPAPAPQDALQGAPHDAIERAVAEYYSGKLQSHGVGPQGVDWRDARSQELRFAELARLLGDDRAGSVVDLGCGYGGLAVFLRARGHLGDYLGLDISEAMIAAARAHCTDLQRVAFARASEPPEPSAYALASGIFNVRLGFDDDAWRRYVLDTIAVLDRGAKRGFAFNCLTSYADRDRMRADLHYADPLALFDHCKRRYSRHVALLHDYGLYEFTILVRKEL